MPPPYQPGYQPYPAMHEAQPQPAAYIPGYGEPAPGEYWHGAPQSAEMPYAPPNPAEPWPAQHYDPAQVAGMTAHASAAAHPDAAAQGQFVPPPVDGLWLHDTVAPADFGASPIASGALPWFEDTAEGAHRPEAVAPAQPASAPPPASLFEHDSEPVVTTAAARIAGNKLDDLSHLELVERLARAMQRRETGDPVGGSRVGGADLGQTAGNQGDAPGLGTSPIGGTPGDDPIRPVRSALEALRGLK